MGKAEAQAVPLTLGGKVTLRSTSRAFSLFCVAGAPSHAAIRSLAFFLSSQIRFRGLDCHILRVFRAIGSVFKSPHAFSFSHRAFSNFTSYKHPPTPRHSQGRATSLPTHCNCVPILLASASAAGGVSAEGARPAAQDTLFFYFRSASHSLRFLLDSAASDPTEGRRRVH